MCNYIDMSKDLRHVTPQFAAWASLLRTHKYLLEQVQSSLSSAGLPAMEWYDVLLELDFAENNRLRMFELGERIVLSRSNLTRLCDRLERQGLIRRDDCAEDLRGLYAVLTPKGRDLRRKMWPVYRVAVETYFSEHVNDDEANTLTRILLKTRNPIGR
jgi:DNA-binding MarR family transcriptional regulator